MRFWICLLAILPFALCGCNQEDDINEIFASGQTWHWSNSYNTSNWENDNEANDPLNREKMQHINQNQNAFNIVFEEDGTVTGNGENFSFTGTWSANGDDHSFFIRLTTQGTPSGLDKTFYDEISTAKFYRGSSILLKLFNADKNHFIQFYPLGFAD